MSCSQLTFRCHSALKLEYDDLTSKSREAEKEVNMLQIKMQEVNDSLFKNRKDLECM